MTRGVIKQVFFGISLSGDAQGNTQYVNMLVTDSCGDMFSEADCEVVDYVTQQLSIFVAKGASIPKLAASEG